jgi:hypothetical protein
MDKNRLRLCVSAGDSSTATEEWFWYFAYCNFNTSGVKSFADDLAVRNGPVSSRVALLLRSAEGKPSFASISPVMALSRQALVGECAGMNTHDAGKDDELQGKLTDSGFLGRQV